jgi:hypothetical protein
LLFTSVTTPQPPVLYDLPGFCTTASTYSRIASKNNGM